MTHTGTACTICRDGRREAIETAAAVRGTVLLEVAQTFGISRRTLERHMAEHANNGDRLAAATTPTPQARRAPSSPAGAALKATYSAADPLRWGRGRSSSAPVSSSRGALGPIT